MKELYTIVAAAGRGTRVGADINKAFLPIGRLPLLVRTLKALSKFPLCEDVAVVVGEAETSYAESLIAEHQKEYPSLNCKVVAGGAERQDSVYHALKNMDEDYRLVAVHDGARPFITEDVFARVYAAASEKGAAIPAVKSADTIKAVRNGLVESTVDRSRLAMVQTPQIFFAKMFVMSYENAYKMAFSGTDDSSIVEFFGFRVSVVEGDYQNIKITTPNDVKIADMRYREEDGY